MSVDLVEQLRALATHYDELARPVVLDELRTEEAAPAASAPRVVHRRHRTLAVAAAVALLAGGVAVALSSRGSGHDTVAPASTTASTIATTTPSTVSPSTTAAARPAPSDATWFELTADGWTPGAVVHTECCTTYPSPPSGPTTLAWASDAGLDHGVLLASRIPIPTNQQFAYPTMYFRTENDGSQLMFSALGIDDSARNALADKVVFEADGTASLGEPGYTLVGRGEQWSGDLRTQAYTKGDVTATLSVGVYRGQLGQLLDAADIHSVDVGGLPGLAGHYVSPDAGIAVWQLGTSVDGERLWATLHTTGAAPGGIDSLLAALVPSTTAVADTGVDTVLHPDLPNQYRTVATLVFGERGSSTGMIAYTVLESLPPQGGDIRVAGIDWNAVDDEAELGTRIWGGPYELVGTWDGTTFTLTQPPRRMPEVDQGTAFVTPGCDETTFTAEREAMQREATGLDQLFTVNVDATDGKCGLVVDVTIRTPEVEAVLAAHADHVVTVHYLIEPIG